MRRMMTLVLALMLGFGLMGGAALASGPGQGNGPSEQGNENQRATEKLPDQAQAELPFDVEPEFPGFVEIPVRDFESDPSFEQFEALEAIDLADPFTLKVYAPTLAGEESTNYAVTTYFGDFGESPSNRASGPTEPLAFDDGAFASVTIGSPGVDADVNAWWDATTINNIETPAGSERVWVETAGD